MNMEFIKNDIWDIIWNLYGMNMEFIWNLYGIYKE